MSRHIDRLNAMRQKYVDAHFQRNAEQYKDTIASATHCDDQRQASFEQTIANVSATRQQQQTEAERLRQTIANAQARLSEFQ